MPKGIYKRTEYHNKISALNGFKKGASSARKGKKFGHISSEHKKHISIALKGKKRSDLAKENIRKGSMGKKCPWTTERNNRDNPIKYKKIFSYPKKKRMDLLKVSEKKHLDGKYRYWMLEVKKRDNWKCKLLSDECKGRLESHHIFNWKDYPELRYVINNGITLCAFHHPRGREEEKRMIPIFQELLSVSKE